MHHVCGFLSRAETVYKVKNYRKCEAKTHGFSRGMKPTTGNQTTRQWQAYSPTLNK
mgnify:CR=1 FL=1